jgi:CheY-like chemotaxis protein
MSPPREHLVLLVEDDPDIRESMRIVLEDVGYVVMTAANGKEALEWLERQTEPCLILLDLMMPVMSGGEFLAFVRKQQNLAGIPVVVVSAWPGEAARLRHQAQGFVRKPLALDSLLNTVAKFCSGGAEC